MRNKKAVVLRCAAFWGIFALLFGLMARTLAHFPDYRSYQSIAGFYEEPADSLDAVYLGSSNCYAFWNAPVAWHNHGIAVYPYTSPSQPFYATEYLMREARKTQPNAMFIVNVNSVEADDLDATSIHYLVNYMPDSENKAALTNYLADLLDYSAIDKLEFRFPWMRMRELWYKRIEEGGVPALNGLKGASVYEQHLGQIEDISAEIVETDQRTPVPEALEAAVQSLLDYCDGEGVRALFVAVPRAEKDAEALGRINAVCDIIRARGYDVLDLTEGFDAVGLDLTQDYYESRHTNLHGSIKFTEYVSRYLVEHYGLEDRRAAGSDGWDAAWARFAEIAAPWALDIELDAAPRDRELSAPLNLTAKTSDAQTVLRWDPVPGADGYAVYFKASDEDDWAKSADTVETSFEDGVANHRYTVVPWRDANGEKIYGNFDYVGVSA